MTSSRIEAVTFDFWNTLIVDGGGAGRDTRIDAWAGILEDAGFATERQSLDQAMASSWKRFTGRWEADQQYTHVEAALEILEELGLEPPPEVHDALLSTFTYATSNYPTPTLNVGACLRALKASGVRLGIICDVGMTPSTVLRDVLRHFELLELFDHWSFSDDVGHYKPSARIFEHALEGLGGVSPDRAAHIGDLRRTDVAGALAMGITAVRYTGCFDDADFDGPEADHVVADHAEIPSLLGLG